MPYLFKDESTFPAKLPEAAKSDEWFRMDKGLLTPYEVAKLASDRFDRKQLFKFLMAIPNYLVPIEEGLEIFYKIKSLGYKTYVLSNMSQYCYEQAICKHDFLHEFDGQVYSYQVKAAKPEPEIYNYLLNEYNLRAEDCLFIDDLEHNINAAKECGIRGIICSNHENVVKELNLLGII